MDSKLIEQIQKIDIRVLIFGIIVFLALIGPIMIDIRVLIFGIIVFLALIGPIMIEIFITVPDSYKDLTISKLLLLSMGATLPVLNIILSIEATKNDTLLPPLQQGTPDLNITAGLFITAFIFYIDLGLQFLIRYSFHVFVIVGMLLELLVIVWSIVQIKAAKQALKKIK